MPTAIAFKYNGVAVNINTPTSSLRWQRTPVYAGPVTLFNYILLVSFRVGTSGPDQGLELRIFTDTPAVRTYEVANQAGLIEYSDIALSNSMYVRTMANNEIYNSNTAYQIILSAVSGVPDCNGTFDGDLVLFRTTPTINNSLPVITNPSAVVDTITISDSIFSQIPIV